MSTHNIFVNLPVKDLERSKIFFGKLGFNFNAEFTDEKAACLVIGDNSYVMLLVEDFFQTFTKKKVVDASTHTEAIIAISAETKEEVDRLVEIALQSGGSPANETTDEPMYVRSFNDPDGHLWEVFPMDPTATQS